MNNLKNNILNNKLTTFLLFTLFFTLPFERIPTFELSGYTIKISYILALLLIVIQTVNYFIGKTKLVFSTEEKALSLFWLLAFFSTFLFSSNKERGYIALLMWGFMFALYFFVSRLITKNVLGKLEKTIIISSILVSLFGIFQFFGDSLGLSENITRLSHQYTKAILGFPRAQSVALEPLYFANFLLVPIFLIAAKYYQNKKFINQYWIILVLFITVSILTVSRGAYIALGISGLVYLVYLIFNKKYIKIMGFVSVVILSVALSFLMIKYLNGTKASQGAVNHSVVYATEINSDGSALDRLGTYKLAIEQFKKRPILGNGLASYGETVTPQFKKDVGTYQTVNNEYLEILAENGLLGLIAFALFFVFYIRNLVQKYKQSNETDKNYIVTISLGLFAILIQYNFFSTLYIIYIWTFLALLKSYATQDKLIG